MENYEILESLEEIKVLLIMISGAVNSELLTCSSSIDNHRIAIGIILLQNIVCYCRIAMYIIIC